MSLQTAHLGIMTADQFKNRTKASVAVGGFGSKFKSRGSDMAQLDLALERWDHCCNNKSIDTAQKLAHVNDISYECNKWISLKSAKSSALSNARRQVVSEVKSTSELAYHYLKNKTKTHGNPLTAAYGRGATKPLEAGYSHERAHYLETNKKENPYSASAVEEVTQQLHGMNYNSFKQNAQNSAVDRVDFMNREQRLKHMIIIQGGKFLEDGGTPVDHLSNGFVMCETYAVDKYGNFFSKRFDKNQTTRANHSSYCAGKEVLCAGTYGCVGGDLVYISNMSGHYRPNGGYLRQVIAMLAGEGISMASVCAAVMDLQSEYTAPNFLSNGGGAADWPHFIGEGDNRKLQISYKGNLHNIVNPA